MYEALVLRPHLLEQKSEQEALVREAKKRVITHEDGSKLTPLEQVYDLAFEGDNTYKKARWALGTKIITDTFEANRAGRGGGKRL